MPPPDRPLRILILEDRPADAELEELEMRNAGLSIEVTVVDGEDDFREALDPSLDLILADYSMPRFGAMAALRILHEQAFDIPLIVVSGKMSEEIAVDCIHLGAADYLLKDRLTRLGAAVTRALDERRLRAEHRQVEEDLRQSERNLADAQRIAHVGSWERDIATGVLRWSDESCRIVGIEPGTFAGTLEAFLVLVHPDDREKAAPPWASIMALLPRELDYRIIRPDGTVRSLHEKSEVILDAAGSPIRLVGTTQDVTERLAAEAERARLVSAVEQTADSIMITEPDGVIVYANAAFEQMTGYTGGEAVGQNPRILKSGEHDAEFYRSIWTTLLAGRPWSGSLVNRRKDGALYLVEASISPVFGGDGALASFVEVGRDVTRERELESALVRDARQREAIETALEAIEPDSTPEEIAAVVCAEIVRLPGITSAWTLAFAHDQARYLAVAGRAAEVFLAGQQLPEARTTYLRERTRAGPWSEQSRLRPEDGAWGEAIAAIGIVSIGYVPLRGAHGVVGAIGFAADDSANADTIVKRLPALATFGSIVGALVAPGLEARNRKEEARATIQAIIEASAFTPFFQPIIEFHTGAVVGYEALSRFADGSRPDVIFGLAAQTGLGIELETATMAAALEAASVLPAAVYLSVNASPALIRCGALPALLARQTRPIVVEITEHSEIEDYPALGRELAALGPTVRLAVDDAGAGYASFRHILELTPSLVKLDIGLVRGIDADPARQALIAGIGYFAVKRGIRLVAEGIEAQADLTTVRSLGVAFGQGYLLGRPQDSRGPGPWPTRIELPHT